MNWDEPPLFEVPKKYRPPQRAVSYPFYRHYKGARMSCDDCTVAIANGETIYVPTAAAYVRTEGQGVRRYLCVRHTQERREAEAAESDRVSGP